MRDSERERVAANVRAELARSGKTQRDAAAVVGMHQPNLGLRLQGKRSFRAEEIARLAEWLGVSADNLLTGVPTKEAA